MCHPPPPPPPITLPQTAVAEDQSQASSETAAVGKDPVDQRMVQLARVLMVTKQQVEKLSESVVELSSRQQDIDGLSTELTGRLTELNGTLGATKEELGRRLAGAMSGTEGHADNAALDRTSELLEAATKAGQRIASVQDQLAARVDRLQEDFTTAVRGIESIGSGAERASSKLDEQIFALKGRVTAFAEGVEQWFKPAQGEIEANKQYVEQATGEIRQQLSGLAYAPVSFLSALDGDNIEGTLNLLFDLRQQARTQIPTPRLNEVLQEARERLAPRSSGKTPKLFYGTQVGEEPLTILVFVNEPKLFRGQYTRYLQKRLQKAFHCEEVPIRLVFRSRSKIDLPPH